MEPNQSNSVQPGATAADIVAPDPQTRELLLRRAAGEKLSPREYGLLGSFSRWLKKPFGAGGTAPEPVGAGSQPRNPGPVAAGQQAEAPGDGLAPVEIDADLAKGVTDALLSRGNIAATTWIEREASATLNAIRSSGEERDKMLARLRLAANLKTADQKLIADLSPYVCQELQINPAKLALGAVVGIMGLHAFNVWQCVQELKDLRAKQDKREAEAKAEANHASAPKAASTAEPTKTAIVQPPTQ